MHHLHALAFIYRFKLCERAIELFHLRPQARNKHRASVIGFLEATMFVEGEFFVVGDHDYAQVVLVDFLDTFHEFHADALALVFGTHEQVMNVGVHDAVVHGADHADKFFAVPSRNDGLEILHRDHELIGEMPRGPFDGEEEVF